MRVRVRVRVCRCRHFEVVEYLIERSVQLFQQARHSPWQHDAFPHNSAPHATRRRTASNESRGLPHAPVARTSPLVRQAITYDVEWADSPRRQKLIERICTALGRCKRPFHANDSSVPVCMAFGYWIHGSKAPLVASHANMLHRCGSAAAKRWPCSSPS